MGKNKSARQKAIIRRRIFLSACLAVLLCIIIVIVLIIKAMTAAVSNKNNTQSEKSNSSKTVSSAATKSSDVSPSSDNEKPDYPDKGPNGLDANFGKLLLVNDKNPLPEDYDYEGNLITVPDSYINGSLKQVDADVWPYMKAMIDAAKADGVGLYIWSPYRSYEIQNMLFQKQVNRVKTADMSMEEAQNLAATVVARPGTSEHHTGLAADFNMADDKFENTEMFKWLSLHAADYGFVMRYSGEKQSITGVIHESWHYRFVGINNAKEMNRLNMCLEEYIEYLKKH